MISTERKRRRWLQAQEYERHYWFIHRERAQFDEWIRVKTERAASLQSWMSKFIEVSARSRILQIGAAGEGEINFVATGDRFAIDPLAAFFKEQFSKVIDPRVDFRQAKGEQLPFSDNYFDGIIMTNVLDHTEDADLELPPIVWTVFGLR